MPFNHIKTGLRLTLAAAFPLLLGSCSEGVRKAPPRKVMPGAYMPQESTETPGLVKKEWDDALPFDTRVVDLSAADVTTTYYSVALPDNFYDSIAFSLAERYRPIALPLLQEWLQSNRKGIVLDLRAANGRAISATYEVTLQNQTMPLQLIWDDAAKQRAEKYINLIRTIPEIQAATTK